MKIGKRFREAREAIDLSQGQVAEYGKTSQSYLSAIEGDKRWPSTWELLKRLASKYNVSADYLLGLIDEPTSRESSTHHIDDPATKELLDLIQVMNASQRTQLAGIARVLVGAPRIIE